MAEQTQTNEITTNKTSTSTGLMLKAENAIDVIKKVTNEPAVQRSIPVIITLFVIFLGIIFFVMFKEPQRTTLFASLPENEKSRVVDVLRSNGIDVSIDSSTGEILADYLDQPTNLRIFKICHYNVFNSFILYFESFLFSKNFNLYQFHR